MAIDDGYKVTALTGKPGEDGNNLKLQYSKDSTNWHETFASGDLYMRTSTDGTTWSEGMRIVGEGQRNQLLRATNKDLNIASVSKWANKTWRRASTASDTNMTRSVVEITDCPDSNLKKGFRCQMTTAAGSCDLSQDSVPVVLGTEYTISCWAKGKGKIRLQYGYTNYKSVSYEVTDTWQKYSFTFTVEHVNSGGSTNIYFGSGSLADTDLYIAGMKMELGNTASDWCEYEEDLKSSETCENLLHDTKNFTSVYGSEYNGYIYKDSSGIITLNAKDGFSSLEYSNKNTSGYVDFLRWKNLKNCTKGGTYTLQFWARGSGTEKLYVYFHGDTNYLQCVSTVANTGYFSTATDGMCKITLNDEWNYYVIKWTLASSGDNTVGKTILFREFFGGTAEIAGVKLEENIIDTNWVPHIDEYKGDTGDTGGRGTVWFQGTAITGVNQSGAVFSSSGITDAIEGDQYLNTNTKDIYKCVLKGNAATAKWAWIGNLVEDEETNLLRFRTYSSQNSTTSNLYAVYEDGEGPFGKQKVLKCYRKKANVTQHSTILFQWAQTPVDAHQKYRFSYFIKQTVISSNCSSYLGVGVQHNNTYICNLSGSANINAYFSSSFHYGGVKDRWYLVVGHVHPNEYTGSTDSDSGVYDVETGKKIGSCTDYKWAENPPSVYWRQLVCYNGTTTGVDGEAWVCNPRIDICNGNQPSIEDLLHNNTHVMQWYSGTGITGTSTTGTIFPNSGISYAVTGDKYINSETNNVYRCTYNGNADVAKWIYETNIKGDTGDTGLGTWTPFLSGVTQVDGSTFKKTGGTNGNWDAQVYSNQGFSRAYATAKASQTTSAIMFGLNSDPTTNESYNSIDYAIYFVNGGNIYIYENGTKVDIPATTYTTSDIFKVEYDGRNVVYYKNSTVLRTVARKESGLLYFDSSFYGANGQITATSFGNVGQIGDTGEKGDKGTKIERETLYAVKATAPAKPTTRVTSTDVATSETWTKTKYNTYIKTLKYWMLVQVVTTTYSSATDTVGTVTTTWETVVEDKEYSSVHNISEDDIMDGVITNAKLANEAVKQANIGAGAVTTAKLAPGVLVNTENIIVNSDLSKVNSGEITIVANSSLDAAHPIAYYNSHADAAVTKFNEYNYKYSVSHPAKSENTGLGFYVDASALTVGETYTVTFLYKVPDLTLKPGFWPSYKTTAGAWSWKVGENQITPTAVNEWQRYTLEWKYEYTDLAYGCFSFGFSGAVAGTCEIAMPQMFVGSPTMGMVDTSLIVDGAIETSKIADGAITSDLVAANAITTNKIATNAITSDVIAANAITTTKITDSAISTTKIASSAITAGKIATGAVTADKIAANAVTAVKIAANAITSDKINANSVTSEKIVATAINRIDPLLSENSWCQWTSERDSILTNWSANHTNYEKGIDPVSKVNALVIKNPGNAYTNYFNVEPDEILSIDFDADLSELNTTDHTLYCGMYPQTAGSDAIFRWEVLVYENGAWGVLATTGDAYLWSLKEHERRHCKSYIVGYNVSLDLIPAPVNTASAIRMKNVIYTNASIPQLSGKKTVARLRFLTKSGKTWTSGEKMYLSNIIAESLSGGQVTAGNIVASAVTAGKIASNAVTAAKINAGAVTTDKIGANAVTAAKIAAHTITSAQMSVGNGVNLLSYGEDTFDQWDKVYSDFRAAAANSSINSDLSYVYAGKHSIKISATSTNDYVFLGLNSWKVKLDPNKKYCLSAYVKRGGTENTVGQLFAILYAAQSTAQNKSTRVQTATDFVLTDNNWHRIEHTFTPTASSTWFVPRLDVDTNGQSAYFSAIQLEEVEDGQGAGPFSPCGTTIINGGNITANTIAASTVNGNAIIANTLMADRLNVLAKNRINNFSITGTLEGWEYEPNMVTYDATNKRLQIVRTAAGSNPWFQTKPFTVNPNEILRLDYYLETKSTPTMTASQGFYFGLNAADTYTAYTWNGVKWTQGGTKSNAYFTANFYQTGKKKVTTYILGYEADYNDLPAGYNETNLGLSALKLAAGKTTTYLRTGYNSGVAGSTWYLYSPEITEINGGKIIAQNIDVNNLTANEGFINGLMANDIVVGNKIRSENNNFSINKDGKAILKNVEIDTGSESDTGIAISGGGWTGVDSTRGLGILKNGDLYANGGNFRGDLSNAFFDIKNNHSEDILIKSISTVSDFKTEMLSPIWTYFIENYQSSLMSRAAIYPGASITVITAGVFGKYITSKINETKFTTYTLKVPVGEQTQLNIIINDIVVAQGTLKDISSVESEKIDDLLLTLTLSKGVIIKNHFIINNTPLISFHNLPNENTGYEGSLWQKDGVLRISEGALRKEKQPAMFPSYWEKLSITKDSILEEDVYVVFLWFSLNDNGGHFYINGNKVDVESNSTHSSTKGVCNLFSGFIAKGARVNWDGNSVNFFRV